MYASRIVLKLRKTKKFINQLLQSAGGLQLSGIWNWYTLMDMYYDVQPTPPV